MPSGKATKTAGSPARQEGRADLRPAQAVPVLSRQGRPGRLQGHLDAAPVHLRARQDPLPADHRRLPPPSEPGRAGGQASARAGAAAVRGRGSAATTASAVVAATATATATARGGAGDASGDSAPGRGDARRARHGRRRLAGLPAQLPGAAQAGRAGDQGLDRGGQAAARGGGARRARGRGPRSQENAATAGPHGADDPAAGRRRRPPVRLGHHAGHRGRDPRRPRDPGRPAQDPPRGADPQRRDVHGRGRGRRRGDGDDQDHGRRG